MGLFDEAQAVITKLHLEQERLDDDYRIRKTEIERREECLSDLFVTFHHTLDSQYEETLSYIRSEFDAMDYSEVLGQLDQQFQLYYEYNEQAFRVHFDKVVAQREELEAEYKVTTRELEDRLDQAYVDRRKADEKERELERRMKSNGSV